jgi:hypothetical protein
MAEIREFEKGDPVTIVRAGRPCSTHYVTEIVDGLAVLDNDSIWTRDGVPISADVRGARLVAASERHVEGIEKAGLIGRIKEMANFMSENERCYRISDARLLAVERALTNLVGEYLSGGSISSSGIPEGKLEHTIKRFTERLQAAEQAEVMRLARRNSPG